MPYAYSIIHMSPSKQVEVDIYERNPNQKRRLSTIPKFEQEIAASPKKVISDNHSTGQLSPSARSKLSNAMHTLRAISTLKSVYEISTKKYYHFRLTMITLTLPSAQCHDDKFITDKCLDVFLKWLYNKHKVNSYVWKAEAQANGNIHFHITTNVFIHWKSVRNKWNSIVNNYGYISTFEKKHNHREPNSTDIHSVRNDNKIAAYIVSELTKKDKYKKYISLSCELSEQQYHKENYKWFIKDNKYIYEQKRPIKSRLWGCSRNLIKCKFQLDTSDNEVLQAMRSIDKWQYFKEIKSDYWRIKFLKWTFWDNAPALLKDKYKEVISLAQKYEPTQKKYTVECLTNQEKENWNSLPTA